MGEYATYIQYDPEDKIYVASVPELKGCTAHGETRQKALEELEIAKELWIETALVEGEERPKPMMVMA